MARLPKPGEDEGTWGDILNRYLLTSIRADGRLKDAVVGSSHIQTGAVTGAKIPDATITENKLSNSVKTKLNAVSGEPYMAGDISGVASSTKISEGVISDASISSTAEIAQSKIANLKSDLAGKAEVGHSHTANAISSGRLDPARLGSGTASTATFLRGDGTWQAPALSVGAMNAVAKAANYTAKNQDFIFANAASGGFTITLPSPANGAAVGVKKIDSTVNAVLVVAPVGSIDDQLSVAVNNQWQSQDFFSDGTSWYRV